MRNLFLEVSWLYLSRFPGALKTGPNPWLLGLGVLSSPFVCLYLCFHRAATGLAVAAAVCCCSAAVVPLRLKKKSFDGGEKTSSDVDTMICVCTRKATVSTEDSCAGTQPQNLVGKGRH